MAVLRNSFQLDLSDQANVARLLQQAADLARHVPVFALHYPRDYARLPAVLEYLRTLEA